MTSEGGRDATSDKVIRRGPSEEVAVELRLK